MTGISFDPLPKDSAAPAKPPAAPEWRIIQPVPEDAPAPPTRHPSLGAASQRWEYRAAGGELLGLICRYDPKAGKEIRSIVFAEHKRWGRQWRWLGFRNRGRFTRSIGLPHSRKPP